MLVQWVQPNGITVIGITVNGIKVNGIMVIGIKVNGIMVNGINWLKESNLSLPNYYFIPNVCL